MLQKGGRQVVINPAGLNSVLFARDDRIFLSDGKAKEALAQYIVRCPISLIQLRKNVFYRIVLRTFFSDFGGL